MTPPPHESPNPMDQLGMVFTQHHKAKVFLEVDGQNGKKLFESMAICTDKGEPYCYHGIRLWSTYTTWTGMGSVRLICPRHTMESNWMASQYPTEHSERKEKKKRTIKAREDNSKKWTWMDFASWQANKDSWKLDKVREIVTVIYGAPNDL